MKRKGYDVKLVTEWKCPEGGGAPIIAMPNIPKPLHLVNPRNLLGKKTWDIMRKSCYAKADLTCEICGEKQEPGFCDAHELYDIDYKTGTAKFVRTICLCRKCHRYGIHSGRCITLFKHGNPLMPKEALINGAENVFRLIYEYNQEHPEADLRAYSTFLEYLKQPELKEDMEKLIAKYNIKFYEENTKEMASWADWKLTIGNKDYPTPYATYEDWEKAMEEQGGKDTARIMQKNMEDKFSGGVYDELKQLMQETTLSDVVNGTDKGDEAVRLAMKKAQEDMQKTIDKAQGI